MLKYKDIYVKKFLQSGFQITFENLIIYIDPFKIPKNSPKANIIFISHEHFDHLDKKSIEIIQDRETVIVGNSLVRKVLENIENFIEVQPCSSGTINNIKFTCVSAFNKNKFNEEGIPYHPKENNGIGYILDFNKNERIRLFHMGDTDFEIGEHSIPEIDILLIPVSGTYVMTPQEAIIAANTINPKLAIPMHYDAGIAGSIRDAEKFRDESEVRVEILDIENEKV